MLLGYMRTLLLPSVQDSGTALIIGVQILHHVGIIALSCWHYDLMRHPSLGTSWYAWRLNT
jgi:hypothetical protein